MLSEHYKNRGTLCNGVKNDIRMESLRGLSGQDGCSQRAFREDYPEVF